jgi:N utilization substance protein B
MSKAGKLSPRLAARLGAVQALYQMEQADAPLNEVLAEYASRRVGEDLEGGQCGRPDARLLEDIVRGVVEHQAEIDRTVNRHLAEGWKLAKLDATVRAILRAAAYEILHRKDIPPKASISEYLKVARAFFDAGEEPKFINGVLDALARECRADELKAGG